LTAWFSPARLAWGHIGYSASFWVATAGLFPLKKREGAILSLAEVTLNSPAHLAFAPRRAHWPARHSL